MQLARAPRTSRPSVEPMLVYARKPEVPTTDLPLMVTKILELIDGTRGIDEIFEEAQISAEKGLAVVRKLSRLGIIETASPGPARTKLSDSEALERAETLRGLPPITAPRATAQFSAAEEAFFASEVEPALCEEEEPSGIRHRFSLLISDLVLYLRRDVAL